MPLRRTPPPVTQVDQAPALAERARCPRCAYDLQGEVATWTSACPLEGTCPECGIDVHWPALLGDPRRINLPWLFEHSLKRLRALLATLWRTLLIVPLWTNLRPWHRISWWRLTLMVLASTLLVTTAATSWELSRRTAANLALAASTYRTEATFWRLAPPPDAAPPTVGAEGRWLRYDDRIAWWPHDQPTWSTVRWGVWCYEPDEPPTGLTFDVRRPTTLDAPPGVGSWRTHTQLERTAPPSYWTVVSEDWSWHLANDRAVPRIFDAAESPAAAALAVPWGVLFGLLLLIAARFAADIRTRSRHFPRALAYLITGQLIICATVWLLVTLTSLLDTLIGPVQGGESSPALYTAVQAAGIALALALILWSWAFWFVFCKLYLRLRRPLATSIIGGVVTFFMIPPAAALAGYVLTRLFS